MRASSLSGSHDKCNEESRRTRTTALWEVLFKSVPCRVLTSQINKNCRVTRIEHQGDRIISLQLETEGETQTVEGDHFVSSMPITKLVKCLEPAPPAKIIQAANSLSYRDFLIVALIVDIPQIFPDNWIYIHSPDFKVSRIQNFKNWSPKMVPETDKTCLGMEYFCSEGDQIWQLSESELIELASKEVDGLGLAPQNLVIDGTVIRQKKAYPVYDRNYYQHLQVIREYLAQFTNLQTIGRNGMHRYNNQDHSMITGLLAAKNIMGEDHDLWAVNTERSYYESFTDKEWKEKVSSSNQSVV